MYCISRIYLTLLKRSLAFTDVILLPTCSLQTSLDRGFDCFGIFLEGIPYFDRQLCRFKQEFY